MKIVQETRLNSENGAGIDTLPRINKTVHLLLGTMIMPLETESRTEGWSEEDDWSERSAKDERGQVLWMQQLPLCRGKGRRLLRFFFLPRVPGFPCCGNERVKINQKAN